MTKQKFSTEFIDYLFNFWKYNKIDLCTYCKNFIECEGASCSDYEEYSSATGTGYFVYPDGTRKEIDYPWKMTCKDLNFGECSKLEKTPCYDCIENNNAHFDFNGVIPDDFDSL